MKGGHCPFFLAFAYNHALAPTTGKAMRKSSEDRRWWGDLWPPLSIEGLMGWSLDYTRDAQFSNQIKDLGEIGMGREGFEPPKAYASRFTVCPRWPLGYLPLFAKGK